MPESTLNNALEQARSSGVALTRDDWMRQAVAYRIAAERWEELFRDVSIAIGCLPSNFPECNDHVLKKAGEMRAYFDTNEYDAWMDKLAVEALNRGYHPTAVEDMRKDHVAWRGFFDDGVTPIQALDEDEANS